MKQQSLRLPGMELQNKATRKQVFLSQMQHVVPWDALVELIQPYAPQPGEKGGATAYPVLMMLKIHFLQKWYNLSDLDAEESLYTVPLFCEFVGIDRGCDSIPDESTILRFRHLLETHNLTGKIFELVTRLLKENGLLLTQGTIGDATLIQAASSTKNKERKRDPEMRSTKKGNQYHFGGKAHTGVDSESGLVHSVQLTAANVSDVSEAHAVMHGDEQVFYGDAGYAGVGKRSENRGKRVRFRPGRRPSTYKKEERALRRERLKKVEKFKRSMRAKVEHPYRVLKHQFGFTKFRYRGLSKNKAALQTAFALVNLWMVRHKLLALKQVSYA